jgi:hypothetical protein
VLARISSNAVAVFLTLLDHNGDNLWLVGAVAVEGSAFWGVAMCALVGTYQCFGGNFYSHFQGRRVFPLTDGT